MTPLEKVMEELPPELQQEVEDFARFLLETRANCGPKKTRSSPKFTWAGALMDMRDKYTSVELQHEISSWRMTPS